MFVFSPMGNLPFPIKHDLLDSCDRVPQGPGGGQHARQSVLRILGTYHVRR